MSTSARSSRNDQEDSSGVGRKTGPIPFHFPMPASSLPSLSSFNSPQLLSLTASQEPRGIWEALSPELLTEHEHLTHKPGTLAALICLMATAAPQSHQTQSFILSLRSLSCSLPHHPPAWFPWQPSERSRKPLPPLPLILCGFPPTQTVQVPNPEPSTSSQPCSLLRPSMDPRSGKATPPCPLEGELTGWEPAHF